MAFDLDLFVIGGGSGGVRAARIAADEHGAKVGLAEMDRMGGTCVIRGCVPKKLMVFASSFGEAAAEARAYGWQASAGTFSWPDFRAKMHAELDRLEAAYRSGLKNAGVTVYDTRAAVEDAHTVRLDTGETLRARHILIATGGHPHLPEAARKAGAMSSNDIFLLREMPKTMLIVGGGYIACEFACILNGMGVEVTQFYRGEQVLRGFDDAARELIAEEMRGQGIALHTGTDVTAIASARGGLNVAGGKVAERVYGGVLYATGRQPNTEGLGLEALGLTLGPKGEVPVDEWSQTAVPSVFAVGDVTDRVNLTPVAIREGHAFADTVFGASPRRAELELVPSAVFTRPELGSVGLTAAEARAQGPVAVYSTRFRPMRQAFAGVRGAVLMKLVVCETTRRVLGCQIVAPEAGEMIQLAAIAVRMGATKEDFDRTVAVHPTMAEELVTMRETAREA